MKLTMEPPGTLRLPGGQVATEVCGYCEWSWMSTLGHWRWRIWTCDDMCIKRKWRYPQLSTNTWGICYSQFTSNKMKINPHHRRWHLGTWKAEPAEEICRFGGAAGLIVTCSWGLDLLDSIITSWILYIWYFHLFPWYPDHNQWIIDSKEYTIATIISPLSPLDPHSSQWNQHHHYIYIYTHNYTVYTWYNPSFPISYPHHTHIQVAS